MHLAADPKDTDALYVENTNFYKSTDGGKTFHAIPMPHGDNHDVWINPDDPRILIEGNDGGATITVNSGESWSSQLNQPTAEMYRVSVDNEFPYRVYRFAAGHIRGALGAEPHGEFRRPASASVGRGGMEGGDAAVDPENADIVYSGGTDGDIYRFDRRTGQMRPIKAYPEIDQMPARYLKYRFQRTAPIRISPHDHNLVYHTSNYVHRSADGGQHWDVISPDLTTNDRERTSTFGGPITREVTSEEVYCTIYAFEESPVKAGVLWAGTDDGKVQLSQDAGGHWTDVTPSGIPQWGTVNAIDPSPHAAGRAFVSVLRYRLDSFRAGTLFRTDDFGKTWLLLTNGQNGISADHPVRVVREDPVRKGLLYAGTEFGICLVRRRLALAELSAESAGRAGHRYQGARRQSRAVDTGPLVLGSGQSDLPLEQWTGTPSDGPVLFKPRDSYILGSAEEAEDDTSAGSTK